MIAIKQKSTTYQQFNGIIRRHTNIHFDKTPETEPVDIHLVIVAHTDGDSDYRGDHDEYSRRENAE
jgi:hypothetical protein